MCYKVYIGADRPPPVVPWDPATPAFNVEPAGPADAAARDVTGRAFIVLAGSHTHCACGFNVDPGNAGGDIERAARETHASVSALRAYIEQLLEHEPAVDVFVTWHGEESEPVNRAGDVSPGWFGPEFELPEQTLVRVRRQAVDWS